MKAITNKIAAIAIVICAAVIIGQAGHLVKPQCVCATHPNLAGVAACYQFCPQQ
jgi:hypothetical protein